MTAEERLADLEDWLLKEYNATLDVWAHAESPATRSMMFNRMQALAQVARHLITGRDDVVPLFNERLIIFTQHIDFLKRWQDEG